MERKIKIFSFAAILMLAVSVIGCKHNVTNNTPETCSVTFGVDGTGGTLKAKVEGGSEINSGNTVEHGKTVTFTAEPSDNYEVDKWIITGSAFETGTGIGGSTTAKVKITATVNITVSFKLNNYPVTFSVAGTPANGTLKATADGVAETETSPITVEHGKTVTFTATPAAGYRIKEWKLGEEVIAEAGTNTEYTLTVTKPAAVTVSFEPKKALLTLEAGKNTVKVKAKTADGSAIKVEGCTVNELANDTETTLTVTNPERKLALIGDIIELNCSGDENVGGNRPLAELDVSGLTALQKLDCARNHLTALNVQGLTELQELDCRDNDQLATLNVQGCTTLKVLNCRYNKIAELDVSGLTALQELYCTGNRLTALDVSGLKALQELQCDDNNQLATLNVQGCTTLKVLNCGHNQLKTLNVSGLTALKELYCRTNQIPELNVHGLTKLQKLNCIGNRLTALDVSGLTALQELYCSANKLTALNVQGCTALKELNCYKNKLNADAFIKIFNDLPTREASDGAKAVLYNTEKSEGNCKNFTTPETLKKAFDNAKDVKHWKMQKANYFGLPEDI